MGNAYIAQAKPEIENDGWIWMKHGDTGVNNFRPYSGGIRQTQKLKIGYIQAHLMLMPKIHHLDGVSTISQLVPYVMMKGPPLCI